MTVNHLVAGSSPAEAAKFWGRRINGDSADCKSAASGTTGSIPVFPTKISPAMAMTDNPYSVIHKLRGGWKTYHKNRVMSCAITYGYQAWGLSSKNKKTQCYLFRDREHCWEFVRKNKQSKLLWKITILIKSAPYSGKSSLLMLRERYD